MGASKRKFGSRVKLNAFSVHFLFSAACELWRHSRGSILPGWIWGRTHRRRPHSVSSPYPGKSPLPASRPAARPPSGTTYSRPRKKPSAGRCRCPHRQAGRLFPLRRCHAVKGTVRPAFQRRQVFIGVISHAFPPFCIPLPFSPKGFPALARSPQLRDILSRSPVPCGASPAGVFLFGRSFCFQGVVHR